MNNQKTIFLTTSLLFSIIAYQSSHACTDFRLVAKDGSILITRSMEFPVAFESNVRTTPVGTTFNTTGPDGQPAMSWKNKYGYIYLDGMHHNVAVDGMNNQGLSFEALYLPGEAQYQNVPTNHDAQALPYIMLGDWILGNFKTVDELRDALSSIYVFTQTIPGMGNTIFPLHFSVFDKSGNGIVIEYVAGKLNIYDNIGVMTNCPTYGWQTTNLRNYLNLSPYVPNPIVAGGITYTATGQGSGMVGLPGDSSPPSRFVKIAALMKNSYTANNSRDELNLAEHIINNVDIPLGAVRSKSSTGQESDDYTQWVVFKDLSHNIFYYRTYQDPTLHEVDFNTLNLAENAPALKMPIVDKQFLINVTNQLKSPNTN